MKLSSITFAFATVFTSARAGPLLDSIFDTDALIQGACDTALDGLGLNSSLACDCEGDARFFQGVSASVDCTLSPACAAENAGSILCSSSGSVELSYNTPGVLAFLSGDAAFEGNVEACVTIDTGLPDLISDFAIPEVCISVQPTPTFQLESCKATVGTEECACNFCDAALSVTIDCTAVNLLDFSPVTIGNLFVPGPKFECIGLDFAQVPGAMPMPMTRNL